MGHPLDRNGHKKIIKSGRAFIGSSHMTALGAEKGKMHEIPCRPRCGAPAKPCCITCGETFDNPRALKSHTDDKRDHVIADWCTEEVEENRGVDAFGNPQIVKTIHGIESEREIEL